MQKKTRKTGKVIKRPYISKDEVMIQLKDTLDIRVFNKKNLHKRYRPLIEERAQWYYFLYRYTRLSLQEIGEMFNKNHATVIHSINNYTETLLFYPGDITDRHNMLTSIFDPIAEKNRLYLQNRNIGKENAMDNDIVIIKQREMIGKLMQANIKLIERIKKLENEAKK